MDRHALAGIGLLLLALFKWQGLLALGVGYGAMFAGHYIFEKSPPAVVKTPYGALAAAAFAIHCLFIRPIRHWQRG